MRLVFEGQYHSGGSLPFYEDIVLDDKVVPVGNPNGSIRPHFGMHWAKPLVRAGEQVPSIFFRKTCTLRLNDRVMGKSDRRLADKCNTVPVFLRVIPSRVQLDACRGSKTSDYVHLTEVRGHGMGIIMAIDFLN